jgi:hypothetical protein
MLRCTPPMHTVAEEVDVDACSLSANFPSANFPHSPLLRLVGVPYTFQASFAGIGCRSPAWRLRVWLMLKRFKKKS